MEKIEFHAQLIKLQLSAVRLGAAALAADDPQASSKELERRPPGSSVTPWLKSEPKIGNKCDTHPLRMRGPQQALELAVATRCS